MEARIPPGSAVRTPVTALETLSLREVGWVLYSLYCSRFPRAFSGEVVNLRTA
jgi:hypothetical protein